MKNFAENNVRIEQLNKIQEYEEYLQKVNSQQYKHLIVRKANLLSTEKVPNEFFKHVSVNNCIWLAWFLLILYIVNVPMSTFAIFLLLFVTIFVYSDKISRFFIVLRKMIDVFNEVCKNTTDSYENWFSLVCKKFQTDHLEN